LSTTEQNVFSLRAKLNSEGQQRFDAQYSGLFANLQSLAENAFQEQQMSVRNPDPIPKKAWVKNKTHGKADAHTLTGAELNDRILKAREQAQKRAQKQSRKKPTEKAPVEKTPVEEEYPVEGPVQHFDDAIFADDEPEEPEEDSQQMIPWARTSLQAFESQGGTTITVDKQGRQARAQKREDLIPSSSKTDSNAYSSDEEFRPPTSTAPAVLQSTTSDRPKRQRGPSLNYYTLQNTSMSQAEAEARRTKRRFG
ncbi:MAG: hypothetical protein Q9160_009364, partial [Pyrenula sp. 1 TL-2023]